MRISNLVFRFRYGMHALILGLGYFAPWNRWLHLDQGRTSWLLLVSIIGKAGWLTFDQSTIGLLCLATLLAFAAAALRTWAAAYLGVGTVQEGRMRGEYVITAGPYRYVRNPLYAGTIAHTLALALLMPPSGSIFAIVLIGTLQFVLIAGEENFLRQTLGAAYLKYSEAVPSMVPALGGRLPISQARAQWGRGFFGEIYMWGAAFSFLALGSRFNALLIMQGVLISLGLSLVVQALAPGQLTPNAARQSRP